MAVLGPVPAGVVTSHLLLPIPGTSSVDTVFFTLCSQLLCNITKCCLSYTRWLDFDEKLN